MKLKDEKKRIKIIKETINIVSKQGIAGVKIANIAKKVKLSQSNIYIYFENKEDLLSSCFIHISEKVYKEVLNQNISDKPYKLKVKDFFFKVLRAKITYEKEINYMKMFVVSPYFNEEIRAKFEESYDVLTNLITEGQQNMILKNKVNKYLIIASMDGITDKLIEYKNKGTVSISKDVEDSAFEIFWDSVKQ